MRKVDPSTVANTWPARRLQELDIERDLDAPVSKRRYVRAVFDTVATSYDRFTRWFSFGMDPAWKRELVAMLAARVPAGGRVLDLATGTGDLASAISARMPGIRVVGIDLSPAMLGQAVGRNLPRGGTNAVADMTAMPHADSLFDGIAAGYAFRNAPDPPTALVEAHRVLLPGGWLATLDFYLPESRFWRRLFVGYLRRAGRLAGRVTHGVPEAYGYIAPSLDRWMTAAAFSDLLGTVGFEVQVEQRMLLGGIAIHLARRRA